MNCEDDMQIINVLRQDVHAQAQEGLEQLDMDRLMALSPWGRRQTERRFRACAATSPVRYFRDCQSEIARQCLFDGADVLSASALAGFTSPGRLHDATLSRYGLTPGEMRRRGEGVTIHFGFFETQVGVVLMAATGRGLCMMRLCGASPTEDEMGQAVEEMKADCRQAEYTESPEFLQLYADQLVAFLDERSPSFCPPLDILHGTTFQREVWAELQRIQPGETLTYVELAARVGRPTAVRAVANACGKNNLAIAIPCHRVVRSDGSLAGYRWGVEWKERLLALEAELREHRNQREQRERV